jgi:hypothetical protein
VIEFQAEYIPYCSSCKSFAVVGRPDEIFVSSLDADTFSRLRQDKQIHGYEQAMVHVLNMKSKTTSRMPIVRFLELELISENFPVSDISVYPELNYGGKSREWICGAYPKKWQGVCRGPVR